MTQKDSDPIDDFGPVVITYTRAQAITDGVLIDVTTMAKEAGFKWPVAVTNAVWDDCVAWTGDDTEAQGTPQDQDGRLWDVVWMASWAIRSNKTGGDTLLFQLQRVPRDGKAKLPKLVKLKLVVGPGDRGEPVVTIMQPEED